MNDNYEEVQIFQRWAIQPFVSSGHTHQYKKLKIMERNIEI
jgi:hypothetical protein